PRRRRRRAGLGRRCGRAGHRRTGPAEGAGQPMTRTVALFSLGGAPGVTVAALAMAAVWPAPSGAALIEADASGGDIAAWQRLQPSPGITDLAAAVRHRGAGPQADPHSYTQTLPGG